MRRLLHRYMDIQTNCKLEIEDDINYFVECPIIYIKKIIDTINHVEHANKSLKKIHWRFIKVVYFSSGKKDVNI